MNRARTFILLAALLGFTGVLAGTFGAHLLRDRLAPDLLDTFEIGVRYHLIHAVAILCAAALFHQRPASAIPTWAGWAFAAGVVVFSGSLYALALTGERRIGMITPVGGLLLLGGWATLALGALRMPRDLS